MLISYMITDPSYDFKETIKAIKKHQPTFVCYRNKQYYNKDEIISFLKTAKEYSLPFIHIDSAKDKDILKLFKGIHIPSNKLYLISEFKDKIIIASTHNISEIKQAKQADYITYSPIFNSKGRKGKGIEVLKEMYNYHKKIIALGGIISNKEVEKIKNSPAVGFGSIRYFYLYL